MNTKSALRIEYRKRRDALTEDQIADWSIEISNRCLSLNLWEYSLYHLFITAEKNKEVDTSYLLSVLQGKDKQPVVPKMVDDHELEHCLLTDQTTLKLNRWGIPEPLSGISISPQQLRWFLFPYWPLTKRATVWVTAKVIMTVFWENVPKVPLRWDYLFSIQFPKLRISTPMILLWILPLPLRGLLLLIKIFFGLLPKNPFVKED